MAGPRGVARRLERPMSQPNVLGDGLWAASCAALIARFHADADYGTERRRVEQALLELTALYLEREIGPDVTWGGLDVAGLVETTFVLDDDYRRRMYLTLSRFYDFLMAIGQLKPVAATRIQGELESVLGDDPNRGPSRPSDMRGLADSAPIPLRRAK